MIPSAIGKDMEGLSQLPHHISVIIVFCYKWNLNKTIINLAKITVTSCSMSLNEPYNRQTLHK